MAQIAIGRNQGRVSNVQVVKVGVLLVGLLDVREEAAADDASTAPHKRDARVVELPAVVLSGLPQQHEPLGVRHDLRGVQRLPNVLHERGLVAIVHGLLRAREALGCDLAFRLQR